MSDNRLDPAETERLLDGPERKKVSFITSDISNAKFQS